MMTIEEAITRERELAERNRRYCEKYKGLEHVTYYNPNCLKYAEEHEQYAEWLEELSRRRVEELFRKTDGKNPVAQTVNMDMRLQRVRK